MKDVLLLGVVLAAVAIVTFAFARRTYAGRIDVLTSRSDRAEATLESRERTHEEDRAAQDLILSSMEEGVLLFDRNGRVVFANSPLVRHLGSNPTDMDALLPLELQRAARASARSGVDSRLEVETGTPSRWLRATCTPIGEEGSLLVVISDVTEARRLDAVRRDFVANASHELKTPAASIQAAAETLMHVAAEDPASVPRFATQLDREARRLSQIVADLLDLSRLEAGSELDEKVRIDSVLKEEARRSTEMAQAAGVTLTVEAQEVLPIRGSARDIALLIRNLLDNAVSYTKPEGVVTATVTQTERSVELRVADTGIGIPTRDLPRIFERFYRVDRARSRETGGTGLGLAIVRHVAENHGGSVGVKSELGRGTVFIVELPRGDRQ